MLTYCSSLISLLGLHFTVTSCRIPRYTMTVLNDRVGNREMYGTGSKEDDRLDVSVEAVHQDGDEMIGKTIGVRKVFSYAQFFAFSLAYMGVWEGVCT